MQVTYYTVGILAISIGVLDIHNTTAKTPIIEYVADSVFA